MSEAIDDEDFLRELAELGGEVVERTETARESAYHEAMDQSYRRIEDAAEIRTKRILKKRSPAMDEEIKAHIKKARAKERMRTVSHYLCDRCDKPIMNPESGFVVQGNVYVADPSCRGGLIGNAFPDPDENGMISAEGVQETVFCKLCLIEILGLKSSFSSITPAGRPRTTSRQEPRTEWPSG